MDGADGGSLPLGLPWNAFLPLGAAAPGSSSVVGTTSDLTANHFDATYYGTTISFTNAALNLTGLGAELVLIPPKNNVPAVDVTRSYSVSVWVTLGDVGGFRTVVSGEGVTIASFFLQKRADTNAWAFTIPPSDSLAAGGCVIPSGPPSDAGPTPHPVTPVANTQYHLVATHDSTTGQSILYVDGVESGRGTCPLGWADTGVVGIGHGVFAGNRGDNVIGSIAELGLISRVLTATGGRQSVCRRPRWRRPRGCRCRRRSGRRPGRRSRRRPGRRSRRRRPRRQHRGNRRRRRRGIDLASADQCRPAAAVQA